MSKYHITCLGLNASEVEGAEKWSCPTCHRKRKLQLSPTKSPRKRQKQDSPGDSKSAQPQTEVPKLDQNIVQTMDMTVEGLA